MTWSEEQKDAGRSELQRRSGIEATGIHRTALTKAVALFAAALALVLVGLGAFSGSSNGWERIASGLLGVVGFSASFITAGLVFVRILDWHRAAKINTSELGES